jgi:hypothetical protein
MRILFFILMCGGIACCGAFACDPGFPSREPRPDEIQANRVLLAEVGSRLRAWHEAHGRWPTNDEGLSVVADAGVRVFPPFEDRREEAQAMLTRLDAFFDPVLMRSDAGPMSPKFVPYLYENRRDAPPGTFAGSPVDGDAERAWSLAVDDGVYVLSVELKQSLEKRAAEDRRYLLVVLATLGPTILFGVLFALSKPPAARRRGAVVLQRAGGALVFLAALIPFSFHTTSSACYAPNRFIGRRRAPLAEECRRILTGYRDRGAIRPETYQRLVDVLEVDVDRLNRSV